MKQLKPIKEEVKEISLIADSIEAFSIPSRNWELIIEHYNSLNKSKFKLKPIQCAAIIEQTKRSIPPQYLFKLCGYSYNTFNSKYYDLIDELEILNSKNQLTLSESDRRIAILNNPLFILMTDVDRAEGAAALEDFTVFNEKSKINTELLPFKMKARYKDIFGEKKDESGVVNINIKLGGNFVDEI